MRGPKDQPSRQRRVVRWTRLELTLIAVSVFLMLLAASAEAYRWINPPAAPAARREATAAPEVTEAASTEIASSAPTEPAVSEETTQPESMPTASGEAAPDGAPASPAPEESLPPEEQATAEPAPSVEAPASDQPAPEAAAPLTVEKHASVSSAAPGQAYQYTATVTSAGGGERIVELHVNIDGQVDVMGLNLPDNVCTSTNPVVCALSIQPNEPATVVIDVMVRQDATPGSRVVSQALVQDDAGTSAASDQVIVDIVAAQEEAIQNAQPAAEATGALAASQVTPTVLDADPEPDPPTPTVLDADPEPSLPTPTVPDADPEPDLGAGPYPAPGGLPTPTRGLPTPTRGLPTPTSSITRSSPIAQTPQQLPPTAPLPTASANQPEPSETDELSDTNLSDTLPSTAATAPTFGLAGALLGLALTIHATRRVRRADATLTRAGGVADQLAPLVKAVAYLQRSAAAEMDRMKAQSQRLVELMRRGTRRHDDND